MTFLIHSPIFLYYNFQKYSKYYFLKNIDFALILLLILAIIKGINFLRTKKLYWYDSLLFAGVSYSLSILFLGLKEMWYHFVSFTFLSVYLLYLIPKIKFKLIKYGIICFILLNIISMIYRNNFMIKYLYWQKSIIHEFNNHIKDNNYIYVVVKEINPTVISQNTWVFDNYKEYFKYYNIPYDNFHLTTTFDIGPKGSIFIVDNDALLQDNTFLIKNFKQLYWNHFWDSKKYFLKLI